MFKAIGILALLSLSSVPAYATEQDERFALGMLVLFVGIAAAALLSLFVRVYLEQQPSSTVDGPLADNRVVEAVLQEAGEHPIPLPFSVFENLVECATEFLFELDRQVARKHGEGVAVAKFDETVKEAGVRNGLPMNAACGPLIAAAIKANYLIDSADNHAAVEAHFATKRAHEAFEAEFGKVPAEALV